MSDEKNPSTTQQPNLTPQEQAQAKDTANIHAVYATTNVLEKLDEVFPFGFGSKGSVFGSTSFENARLNDMLDLLDSANPSDLEQAGEALEAATKSLNAAAKELNTFIGSVEWKGEAAVEFQRYGSEVVTYAWDIGKVANAAGSQMKVASTGLTSVRNAKPPRDTRADQRKPTEFSELEKTEKKEEYQKAVQVEKDRQEAINQMNRLASFYAVSQSTLAGQEMPKPPESYKAAVPRPRGDVFGPGGSGDSGSSSSRDGLARESSGHISSVEDRTTPTMPRTGGELDGSDPIREKPSDDTRVQIDTVRTPPPPTIANTPPTPTAPTNTAPPTGPGMPPPLTLGTPPRAGGPKITGNPGGPRTATGRTGVSRPVGPTTQPAVGRAGGPKGPQAMGRTAGPTSAPAVGRPGNPTGSPAVGRTGGPTSSPTTGRTSGPMGRAGGPSATPQVGRAGQPVTGRTAGGKANPIVGGTPQRTTGGSTGSRIPRGTVVGSEGAAAGRTGARPSQAGVVGGNNAKATPRPAGRGTPSSNGVVGTPRGMGGRANQRPAREEEEREGSTRPDYLTEDEETWNNRRRGAVPPVID
ncbi:hypothetical protein [Streptomyces sp. NRRL F-5727]|uniref:hypothetical protein n=1 Tax=Streptomyces sp. NRRL F-5727 TaxID=1463871 RepID=UPI0004C7B07D|nr:hypothetical protein [Streptomyces sp. NRRL F-5727]